MNTTFHKLNFTRNETRVLLLLLVLLFVGFGLKLFVNHSSGKSNFDYQKAGKIFSQNSGMQINDTNPLNSSTIVPDDTIKTTDSKGKTKTKKGENLAEKSININTAAKDQLVQLPGVGNSTADKIIEYRETHGSFKRIEDIMKIKGIGQKKFDKMKAFITVE
ncbi:MAG: helix-hairpin-helix domain-containing protein [Candidatus Kapaibacterium sp.]